MISPGKLWQQAWDAIGRGSEELRDRRRLLPRIEEWSWAFWNEAPQGVPVHVVAGEADWLSAAWTLASWFHASENAWPVVIHDDGTLPAAGRKTLQKLFHDVRLISRQEADAALNLVLSAYPFCQELRKLHPASLRIFDAAHFTPGDHYLQFASDVLFFAHPREIMEWARDLPPECWLQQDCREGSLLTAAEARDELGIRLWPRAHAGVALIHKPAIDLDFCDRALAQTSLLSGGPVRIVNTLTMACAAAEGRGGLLSTLYSVSEERAATTETVSQQYAGSARERLYAQGLKQLLPVLLPVEE